MDFGVSGAASEILANTDERVMDADLRDTSRLKLELLVQQNAGQQTKANNKRQTSNRVAAAARLWRSKSLTCQPASPSAGLLARGSEQLVSRLEVGEEELGGQRFVGCELGLGAASERCEPRRWSLALAGQLDCVGSGGFGRKGGPSIRLVVRQLGRAGEWASAEERQQRPAARLLGALASLGRQSERRWFELELVEARNLLCGLKGCERELAGALVAASWQSRPQANQRRPSLGGVFARVFKRQASSEAAGWRPNSSATTAAAAAAVAPPTSGQDNPSNATPNSGAHFLQLPLVKLNSSAQRALKFGQLAPAGAYTLLVSEDDFPIRISLYQVERRGGARYTLGHCFLSPDHWTRPGGARLAAGQEALQLEYQLHQTILDAIK